MHVLASRRDHASGFRQMADGGALSRLHLPSLGLREPSLSGPEAREQTRPGKSFAFQEAASPAPGQTSTSRPPGVVLFINSPELPGRNRKMSTSKVKWFTKPIRKTWSPGERLSIAISSFYENKQIFVGKKQVLA